MARLKEGDIVYHKLDGRKMVCIKTPDCEKRKDKQTCRYLSPDNEYLDEEFYPYELLKRKPKS